PPEPACDGALPRHVTPARANRLPRRVAPPQRAGAVPEWNNREQCCNCFRDNSLPALALNGISSFPGRLSTREDGCTRLSVDSGSACCRTGGEPAGIAGRRAERAAAFVTHKRTAGRSDHRDRPCPLFCLALPMLRRRRLRYITLPALPCSWRSR